MRGTSKGVQSVREKRARGEDDRKKRRVRRRSQASDSQLRNFTGFGFFTLLRRESQVLVRCSSDVVYDLTLVWLPQRLAVSGSSSALINRRLCRSLEIQCRPSVACPVYFFSTGKHLASNPRYLFCPKGQKVYIWAAVSLLVEVYHILPANSPVGPRVRTSSQRNLWNYRLCEINTVHRTALFTCVCCHRDIL